MSKTIHVSGSRKAAIARATLRPGKGVIRVNKKPLDMVEPAMLRLKMKEPLLLAGDKSKKVNIDVNVMGGGVSSQAEASRLAIARALVAHDKSLEKEFAQYDRHLLVADSRSKETRKPNCCGKARSKRQKSYR